MVRPIPHTLRELIGFGGEIVVQCKKCGRKARFSPYTLSEWFRANGKRDDWNTIRRKFVCTGHAGEGCGSRGVDAYYQLAAPEPPRMPPTPRLDCPEGIDPDKWDKADAYERKRLLRSLR